MERKHVAAVIEIAPQAFVRTFTLPEIVRRIESLPPIEGEPRTLAESIARIAATRTNRDLLRITAAEEIADPIGRSGRVFDHTADAIADLVDRLLEAQWPSGDVDPTDRRVGV
jgi:hypothetical protein